MYFNGVGFGINPHYKPQYSFESFGFSSSQGDENSYDLVKDEISKYYGEGEETGWHYCYWRYNNISIQTRPLHTEDGGLVMFWELN